MQDDTSRVAAPGSDQERVQAAWNQLNLVLGFFPRVDTRLSAVLALDLGMLAFAGDRWSPHDASWWVIACAVAFALPICASFYHLWDAIVPDRRGGTNSLVFFRSIARLQESEFRQKTCEEGGNHRCAPKVAGLGEPAGQSLHVRDELPLTGLHPPPDIIRVVSELVS